MTYWKMRNLTIIEPPLPPLRYSNLLVPLSLHTTKGRNVHMIADRGIARRTEAEFCQGYVFTACPMRLGQTIVIQILATESAYAGSLAIGLTSCDPATLTSYDLPDDADLLLDRPEYWVVGRNAGNGLRRGDQLAVTLTIDGEVRMSKNGSTPITAMHVDHTLRLWAFVDIYGITQKVRMLSSEVSQPAQTPSQHLKLLTSLAAPLATGTGDVENGDQNFVNHQQGLMLASDQYIEPIQASSQLCFAGLQPIVNPHCQLYTRPRTDNQCLLSTQKIDPSTSRQEQLLYAGIEEASLAGTECRICYENPVDSVLYTCGHMCMCYRCAIQQWKGMGGGQCPLCRALIKDVIRTYK